MSGIMSTEWAGTALTAPPVVNTFLGGADMAQRTCSVDGCDRPSSSLGLCSAHYSRLRDGRSFEKPLRPRGPLGSVRVQPCTAPGCERIAQLTRGMCPTHYSRLRLSVPRREPLVPLDVRFWAKVAKGDGCWEWTASRNSLGYGNIRVERKRFVAHRVAWALTYGPIPDGLFVCHHCDNPPCCRPDHLFLGTHADNMADMVAKGRCRKSA